MCARGVCGSRAAPSRCPWRLKRLVLGLSPHRGGQDGRGRARPALHPAAQAPGAESAGQVLSAGRLMNDFVHCGTENTLLLFLHKCASKSLSLLLLFAGSNCTRILFSASREVLVGAGGSRPVESP